jgi:hypothetical protein
MITITEDSQGRPKNGKRAGYGPYTTPPAGTLP